ncbi:MAG TPA: hypothetical protein VGR08_01420 [Thermomicrobiales bacterium]|nr:hypothetical protein [Thermomicrobiales bacterium]
MTIDAAFDETEDASNQWRGSGRVVVLSPDLFFGMRIRTSLRQLGYVVAIAKDAESFHALLSDVSDRAVLALVDFNTPMDWTELDRAMSAGIPVVAFGPHTDVEGFRAAKAAGVARVVSNGEFSRSLPALAKRHSLQEASDRSEPTGP